MPRGLAWCPRAKPRWHEALHGARPRAKPRHVTRATGPCLVPASQAKVARGLAWCLPVSQAETCDACHGALLGAREPSQVGTRPCMVPAREPSQGGTRPCMVPAREPSQDTRHVPWGLAWCPRAKPRWHEALHGARPRAKPRHATRATGPCLVPASQAKVARGLTWCPPVSQAKTHDACHGALLGAREPTVLVSPLYFYTF